MAKIDVAKLPGYKPEMTAEEKLALLDEIGRASCRERV